MTTKNTKIEKGKACISFITEGNIMIKTEIVANAFHVKIVES